MKLLGNQFEFLIFPARLEHALTSKRFVHWQKKSVQWLINVQRVLSNGNGSALSPGMGC